MKIEWLLNKCAGDVNILIFDGSAATMDNCRGYCAGEALREFKASDTDIKDIRINKNNIMIQI